MVQLQTIESQLIELGYQIIAVSPDLPEHLRRSAEKNKLNYTLVSDSKMTAAKAFGVAFRIDDQTVGKYKGMGLDLEKVSGEKHHLLPVPAVFVIGKGGIINFQYVNPNFMVRLHPDVLLAAAKVGRD